MTIPTSHLPQRCQPKCRSQQRQQQEAGGRLANDCHVDTAIPIDHEFALPAHATARYGHGTAAGIGMLHGVGVESPTQIAIFVASTAAVGVNFGLFLLATWVVGLILANGVIAGLAGAGLLHAERSFPIYATLAVVVSLMSIGLGVVYLLGFDILPAILI